MHYFLFIVILINVHIDYFKECQQKFEQEKNKGGGEWKRTQTPKRRRGGKYTLQALPPTSTVPGQSDTKNARERKEKKAPFVDNKICFLFFLLSEIKIRIS